MLQSDWTITDFIRFDRKMIHMGYKTSKTLHVGVWDDLPTSAGVSQQVSYPVFSNVVVTFANCSSGISCQFQFPTQKNENFQMTPD